MSIGICSTQSAALCPLSALFGKAHLIHALDQRLPDRAAFLPDPAQVILPLACADLQRDHDQSFGTADDNVHA